jgi:hypothetical protein
MDGRAITSPGNGVILPKIIELYAFVIPQGIRGNHDWPDGDFSD